MTPGPMDETDMEMTCALRRAGIVVSPARWAAMRHAYLSYQAVARVLDEPLPYTAEPAGTYALAPARPGGAKP